MTNFEKLVSTLEAAGAKVSQMKKNFGDIYTVENNGKQIIVKMYKENSKGDTLYSKVYIDGKQVYSSSIKPATEGKSIEAMAKDLLDFINTIFKADIKDVKDEAVEETPAPKEEEVISKDTKPKATDVKVGDVVGAIKAIDGIVEGLEVVKDILVKLIK